MYDIGAGEGCSASLRTPQEARAAAALTGMCSTAHLGGVFFLPTTA